MIDEAVNLLRQVVSEVRRCQRLECTGSSGLSAHCRSNPVDSERIVTRKPRDPRVVVRERAILTGKVNWLALGIHRCDRGAVLLLWSLLTRAARIQLEL